MQSEYAITTVTEKYAAEAQAVRPPLSMLLDHLDYIVKLAGVDHVGLGSDFDGISSAPQQLDDVTSYPLITKALLERGYSRRDVKKIMGGNLLRVYKANIR
jgi:membrane dipeptidase